MEAMSAVDTELEKKIGEPATASREKEKDVWGGPVQPTNSETFLPWLARVFGRDVVSTHGFNRLVDKDNGVMRVWNSLRTISVCDFADVRRFPLLRDLRLLILSFDLGQVIFWLAILVISTYALILFLTPAINNYLNAEAVIFRILHTCNPIYYI
jgi:hypothetical protein